MPLGPEHYRQILGDLGFDKGMKALKTLTLKMNTSVLCL